ncbi:MAG: hypothetical protein H6575_14550 [Lewinellaceae bacterium]|nr:hypothetical protein [Lewinellaceae bacterium]
MSDFQQIQQQLSQTRAAQKEAEDALFRSSEQMKQVSARLSDMDRWYDADNPAHQKQRKTLEGQQKKLEGQIKQRQGALEGVKGQLTELYPAFWEQWTDPRKNAGQMNDDIPVMLFPLRLETRFKVVETRSGGQQHQLWVRIYPDECLVDTFEETLSETELRSAGIFWQEYFRAAGVENEERAAWRGLVASHGSGRATWIVQHYRPLNPLNPGDPEGDPALDMKPQGKAVGTLILVVQADETLTAVEKTALSAYWEAIWKAEGKSAASQAAQDALVAGVGAARAQELAESYAPYNLVEAPADGFTRDSTAVQVFFMVLPGSDALDTKTMSWMKAAQAELLPERFVLLGYQNEAEVLNELSAPVQGPFHVSPDPTTDTESQFQFDEHGNLIIGDELRWMLDFDEAVRRGMGFRVNLTPQQAQFGFDRLFVLGIRLSDNAAESKTALESLFQHHYFSRTGFAFLPQGSPTNNTEEVDSAYSREDDADASFNFVFKGQAQFEETEDQFRKRDGQLFAESLGLDTEWLKQVPHAGDRDQCEARAMNTALWPATLGYFMDTLLQPVFNDDDIYYTRWFFNRFVSGRGMIPGIRIGRQPYGILPATPYSKIGWVYGEEKVSYIDYSATFQEKQRKTEFKDWLWKYKGVLDQLYKTWSALSQQVSRVDPDSQEDPHQALLDILGLHPASVEFHQRYANTRKQEHNIALMWQIVLNWATLPANELHNQAFSRLQLLGYTGDETPKLFDLFWKVRPNRLLGPIIQEGALSETDPLRIVTENNRNYIEWLHEWAKQSFDNIRVQDGFVDNKWPNALLYVLLKHALELGYHDAGVRVLDDAKLLDNQGKKLLYKEPHFFHIEAANNTAGAAAGSSFVDKSRYELLYMPNEQVTGHPTRSLVDHITLNIGELFGTRYLKEQLEALEHLLQTPTARLERLLAEHLDCCTYRLDAWMNGLVNFQLASMRYARRADGEGVEEGAQHRKGIYIGAYGWLENVQSENKKLSPVDLSGNKELNTIFNEEVPERQRSPLFRDSTNEGYIHAPSVNHAVTAAILRNGYIAHATPQQPELLKVNLSSERVRLAMGVIDGIRNGQSLAALLGYQFERGLHDRYNFAECDQFIYPLRLVFPLYTRQEDLPDGVSIEAVEARNVVNGLKFIRHIKNAAPANKTYPFGFPVSKLPAATPAQQTIINSEVNRMLDLYDAVADLAVAEGVHQVVTGNYDRAAATLDAYSQASFPPLPEVAQTPRSGIGITHRVALHLDAEATAAASDNPRIKAEPAIQQWIGGLLPAPAKVSCRVRYEDAATGTPQETFVTQADLGLQALDLLYIISPENTETRSELEDRVRDHVLRNAVPKPRPDIPLEITYTETRVGDFTFFEITPMVRSLRALLLRSRHLRSTDAALPNEAQSDDSAVIALDRSRADFLVTALEQEKTNRLVPLLATLDAVFPEPGPDTAGIFANIDQYLDDLVAACRALALYGLPQTGFGIFYETKGGIFKTTLDLAAETAARWQDKLDAYDALIATLPVQPGDPEKIAVLQQAEIQISTTFTDPTGLSVADMLTAVEAKKNLFEARKNAFEALGQTSKTTIHELLSDFNALLPVSDFDLEEVTAEDIEKRIVVLAEDLRTRTQQLIADIDTRRAGVQDKLDAHDAEAGAEKKVQYLTDAARLVFGDAFVLVPAYSLPEKQADEWANAYATREQLLDYQKNTLLNDFPVDDWLYGTARVRDKMHHLENLGFLAEAFGASAPSLTPLQFPWQDTAPWLALEFPPEAKDFLNRENVLYSAIYTTGFDKNKAQCGLLLDDWTEVIPAETETTGITFHFDKPNAEPPQAILLCTPSEFRGAWTWEDLVDTLHETLDMARIRAVEPKQLDQTELSVFLPAAILATTWHPVTIAADLAVVNKYIDKVVIANP